jgi:hypothetical protein
VADSRAGGPLDKLVQQHGGQPSTLPGIAAASTPGGWAQMKSPPCDVPVLGTLNGATSPFLADEDLCE